MAQPFYLKFKNETVIIPTEFLGKKHGAINFSSSKREEYLKTHRPDLIPEYNQHIKNFEKRFSLIESKIIR